MFLYACMQVIFLLERQSANYGAPPKSGWVGGGSQHISICFETLSPFFLSLPIEIDEVIFFVLKLGSNNTNDLINIIPNL